MEAMLTIAPLSLRILYSNSRWLLLTRLSIIALVEQHILSKRDTLFLHPFHRHIKYVAIQKSSGKTHLAHLRLTMSGFFERKSWIILVETFESGRVLLTSRWPLRSLVIPRLAVFSIRVIIVICEGTAVERFALGVRVQVLYFCSPGACTLGG